MHRIALALVAFLLTPGCPVDEGLTRVGDGAPPTRVQATIEVDSGEADPHTVSFGEVEAGSFRDATITITNIGADALQVRDLFLSNEASFSLIAPESVGPILAPDVSAELTVRYSPSIDETVQATLVVGSNDRETPEVPVTLRADGLAPTIDIDPLSFDFGDRELGCVGNLPISIRNVGRAPLILDDIRFEDLGGAGEMTLQLQGDPQGMVLNPSDPPLVATVFYNPTDVAPDTGVLSVTSNDPTRPEATATQFGTAHLGEWVTEEFAQSGDNATDILWVVDNSGSMGGEQSALAANFASFIQIVEALGVDYQIGVVTTDVGEGGVLRGSTPVLTPNTPSVADAFAANVNVGTNGSPNEKAFDSAWMALNSPNTDPGGPNAGFLRDDAALYVISVSDEQEQSSNFAGGDPATYVSMFQSLKANPDHVVMSDITGGLTGGGCASSGSDFVAASVLTGGISVSICTPDWVGSLSALGWLAQSAADTFELSSTPVPNTVEVRLSNDGINYVPVYVGWVFDPNLNAVVFDLDHVPDNGDFIQIGYAELGNCEG